MATAVRFRFLADAIKKAVTVPLAASWYGYDYDSGGGDTRRYACPKCAETSTSRKTLALFESGARWWCYHCSEGGDVIAWIAAALQTTLGGAIDQLAERCGVDGAGDEMDMARAALTREDVVRAARVLSSETVNARAIDRSRFRWFVARGASLPLDRRLAWEAAWQRLEMNGEGFWGAAALEVGECPSPCLPNDDDFAGQRAKIENDRRAYLREFAAGTFRDYAASRGLVGPVAAVFGVGACPANWRNHMRGRLTFEVRDLGGVVRGFGGRLVDPFRPGQPKYLNSPDSAAFSKRNLLFGLDVAAPDILRTGTAVVVEGYVDVCSCYAAGVPAVAPLGSSMTTAQARLLARLAKRVVVMGDGDDAGRKATANGVALLRSLGVAAYPAYPPDGMDPDDLARTRPRALRRLVDAMARGVARDPLDDARAALAGP